jgi:hypothetical protein
MSGAKPWKKKKFILSPMQETETVTIDRPAASVTLPKQGVSLAESVGNGCAACSVAGNPFMGHTQNPYVHRERWMRQWK